ncbi:MAG: hypothetical protein R3C56_17935 [Pirellulaceae bacterium]
MVWVNPEGTGQALEIMLIEDSLVDARLTIEALRRCGIHHRLSLFRDGSEAIEFLYQRGVFSRGSATGCCIVGSISARHRRSFRASSTAHRTLFYEYSGRRAHQQ